ncbi:hypothetical protein B0H21DRAFT_794757 [Amylocystis lapponica]|nr:hypothetical protein B0H21DRAFT_794757 [Amylocystis lapponica]
MIFSVVSVLALTASAFGLTVTSPTNTTGWTTSGDHTVSWSAVSTDPTNITVVLVNMNEFPNYSQVLDALVQTSQGSVNVNPPSSGWPTGAGFQVNLVASSTQLTSILAQSDQFTLKQASSSSSGSSTSGSSSSGTSLTVNPTSTSPSSASGSSSGPLNPSSSDTSTNPSNSNGAAPAMGMQAAVFGFLALLGVVLA